MMRFKLRQFLLVVTLLCFVVPPVAYRLFVAESEMEMWNNFHRAKARRDLALGEWRTSNKAFEQSAGNIQTVANAAERYYAEDADVQRYFAEIVERYDLEFGPNGTIVDNNPKFMKARKRYTPKPSSAE